MGTKKHLRFFLLYALWIAGIVWLLGSCTGSKRVLSEEAKMELKKQADSRSIKVKAEWAIPLTTNATARVLSSGLMPPGSNVTRINLINTPNAFEIRGDSLYVDLPYYGERQIGNEYPGSKGISFTGLIEGYKSGFENRENAYRITFDTADRVERFDVTLKLYPKMDCWF